MTQHATCSRQTGLNFKTAAELTTEQQPPENDSAFLIIYRGLSLLQTKCLWDHLTASETFLSDSCCIWQFFTTSRRDWKCSVGPICTIHSTGTKKTCWTELREAVGRSQEESDCRLFTPLSSVAVQNDYKHFGLQTWSENTSHDAALRLCTSKFVWSRLSSLTRTIFTLADWSESGNGSPKTEWCFPESTWKR